MAELHRYVDENGNVFSMTLEDARKAGYKPYVEPPPAEGGETDEETLAKARGKPPADKAR